MTHPYRDTDPPRTVFRLNLSRWTWHAIAVVCGTAVLIVGIREIARIVIHSNDIEHQEHVAEAARQAEDARHCHDQAFQIGGFFGYMDPRCQPGQHAETRGDVLLCTCVDGGRP